MKSIPLSIDQMQFIRDTYPTHGGQYCAEKLDVPYRKISKFCCKNHIKVTKDRKLASQRASMVRAHESQRQFNLNRPDSSWNINPDSFIHVTTSEAAYILGLLWGDGYIRKNDVRIEAIKSDLSVLLPVFERLGLWFVNYRNRPNRQPQMTIGTNNRKLADHLKSCGYLSKSQQSACSIISRIPENLRHYWFRGVIDADGCFYFNAKNRLYQFSLASSYDQDWTYMHELGRYLGISFITKRMKQMQHGRLNGSSIVRLTNRRDIAKLAQYIYQGYDQDKIGLNRKYDKWMLIFNSSYHRTNKTITSEEYYGA